MATYKLLCEQEMANSHNPQAMAIKRGLMVPQLQVVSHSQTTFSCFIGMGKMKTAVWLHETKLQVVGHVPKKNLPINLFDIHVRLYRCVKIWMVKIWQTFGQSSILPNFSGAKVCLHTVHKLQGRNAFTPK